MKKEERERRERERERVGDRERELTRNYHKGSNRELWFSRAIEVLILSPSYIRSFSPFGFSKVN